MIRRELRVSLVLSMLFFCGGTGAAEDAKTKRFCKGPGTFSARPSETKSMQTISRFGPVAQQREEGVPDGELPPKPTRKDLRSWNVPGRSPSDAASCYNGMFGVFKGLNIKGVLFHQGYNNAMGTSCWPKRYRALVKLMVEGWREDSEDENLPVGVIGCCAGGVTRSQQNFEHWTVSPAAFIRESQRLGLADLKDPEHTGFLPAYDQQLPGLHTRKKQFLATRAARWALGKVYGMPVTWETAELASAERDGEQMVLTFDRPVAPDDNGPIEGVAIAGADGKYYKAYAESLVTKDQGIWGNKYDRTKLFAFSPLVKQPDGQSQGRR